MLSAGLPLVTRPAGQIEQLGTLGNPLLPHLASWECATFQQIKSCALALTNKPAYVGSAPNEVCVVFHGRFSFNAKARPVASGRAHFSTQCPDRRLLIALSEAWVSATSFAPPRMSQSAHGATPDDRWSFAPIAPSHAAWARCRSISVAWRASASFSTTASSLQSLHFGNGQKCRAAVAANKCVSQSCCVELPPLGRSRWKTFALCRSVSRI
jgi:hypothetical protein